MTMVKPRVFNGHEYVDIPAVAGWTSPRPLPDGDGSIFVSIASYRGRSLPVVFRSRRVTDV